VIKFLHVKYHGKSWIGLGFLEPGAHFSKAPETFRAHKAIFSPSVSKNGEVYMPETSCTKGTSLHTKNM